MAHAPVMLAEALTGLGVRARGIYIDATYGRGGHSSAILEQLGDTGMLHAFDRDPQAAADAWQRFAGRANFRMHAVCYSTLAQVCRDEGIAGRVDGALFDLGVSSPQLDDAQRGFSLQHDGPLDMRMDTRGGESAAQWLARAREEEISGVLWRYGEERASRRIARAIVAARQHAPIITTGQLAELVLSVHRGPRQKIHPATRTFQAIRIHLNQELDRLPSGLEQAVEVLAPGGRLVVISFHSLEDRIVKRFMRGMGTRRDTPPPISHPPSPALRTVGRYFPTTTECHANPRARSAVLRVAERLAPEASA